MKDSEDFKVSEIKEQLINKINDIDKMLSELDFTDNNEDGIQNINPKIDINVLDVVDVLHGILN